MDKSRCVLKRLDQVRLNSIFEQRCHSALCVDIADGNRLAVIGVGNNHSAQALFKIFDAGSKAEYCHDLGSNGNIKAILSWHAVGNAAKAVNNVSELAIIHVNAALPHDTTWINVKAVALLDVVIQHGCAEIVCSADGVEVSGKVKVNVLHRNYLGISATRSTTLDTKDRTQRRLSKGQHGRLSQAGQGICQTYRGSSLSLTCWRWVNGGYQHKLSAKRLICQSTCIKLCLIATIRLQKILWNTCTLCHLEDGKHLG